MPVADHPIHPSTQHAKHPAGCFDRKPFKTGYWCYVREYFVDGNFMMTYAWIEHLMTTECQQDGTLEECQGCKHRRVK